MIIKEHVHWTDNVLHKTVWTISGIPFKCEFDYFMTGINMQQTVSSIEL